MKQVNLGKTGLRVSRVCLGMMSYGNGSERPWALDRRGVTFFDASGMLS